MSVQFLEVLQSQQQKRENFAVATVVQVHGSASARTGSKAIFDLTGKNVFGWVGGGCAERFVGEQSVEAIQARQTRIVTADLDDEIFGLGIACGGKMDIFIEPVFPDEVIRIPRLGLMSDKIQSMARSFGWPMAWSDEPEIPTRDFADAVLIYIDSLLSSRQRQTHSLRTQRSLPVEFQSTQLQASTDLMIVGQSRITEALARLAVELGWTVDLKAHQIDAQSYPQQIRCDCLQASYDDVDFKKGQMVVVASHHSQDPITVGRALDAGCSYVGMIGSRKRALEVIEALALKGLVQQPLYVPAGLDLDARGPEEIALSLVGEILLNQRETRGT